jgi:hypothetical protein
MAFSHGSVAVFKVQDAGGVLRDISAFITGDGLERSIDTAETSTHGVSAKTYIPGLQDVTVPLEGNFDPTVDGYLDGIRGLVRTWEYYPAGEPVGAAKPKYSGSAILTNYKIEAPVDDVTTWSAELQVTGAVTRAVA